jgi:hypothetical protein
VDPLADDNINFSPFAYVINNPLRFIDPDGRGVLDIIVIGSNNSSFTIKTNKVNSTVTLSDYGLDYDFKGKFSFSVNELKPDAIGLDLSGAASFGLGGTAGLNLIWHTRGEKKENQYYPEVHSYKGLTLSNSTGANGNVGIVLGWATKDNGAMASDEYVANGVNWTGKFWSAGVNFGGGWASGGASYFTARNPFTEASGEAWSGIQFNWSPGKPAKGKNGSLVETFKNILSKNKGLNYSESYYYMIYGNGSDFLNKNTENTSDDKKVNGWHILNPIDPKDNK